MVWLPVQCSGNTYVPHVERSYSTVGPVSAGVGDRLWTRINHLGAEPGTQAYSA